MSEKFKYNQKNNLVTERDKPLEVSSCATDLRRWCLTRLPELNNDIRTGKSGVQSLVSEFSGKHQKALQVMPQLDRDSAREILGYTAFGALSVERHLRDQQVPPNAVFNIFPQLEGTFTQLSSVAKHPPRDSLYTYSLWNNEEDVISFSGDKQEKLFINVTGNMTNLLTEASGELRDVIHDFNPDLPSEDSQKIRDIANTVQLTRQQLLRFLEKNPEGQMALQPEFFLTNMRQYWCDLDINGQKWGPPTPANCVPQMQLDFLLGTTMQGYEHHVQSKFRYMTEEDETQLKIDMKDENLLNLVTTVLKKHPSDLNEEDYGSTTLNQNEYDFLDATHDLLKRSASLTALHWTILTNYLVKPMKKQEDLQKYTQGPVDNLKGASGMDFSEVENLRDMRRLHPAIVNLGRFINK